MDKPTWIDRLLTDTHAYIDFIDYCEKRRIQCLDEMQRIIVENQSAALIKKGEADCWSSLQQQLKTYEREERSYAAIQQEQRR